MTKNKAIISLILNSLIFVVTTGIVISYFCGNTGVLINYGYESFMFFTTDSNVLAAIASLLVSVWDIMIIRGKKTSYPKAVTFIKYIASVSVMLTFCTVIFFLAPIYGAPAVLTGTSFHMHAAAPLMSLISLCFIENNETIPFIYTAAGIVPMFIYAIVYTVNVVFIGFDNGGWKDFYAFNANGTWYISAPIMIIAAYVIAVVTLLLHNLMLKRKERS